MAAPREQLGMRLMQEHAWIVATHGRTRVVAVAATCLAVEVRALECEDALLPIARREREAVDSTLPCEEQAPHRRHVPSDPPDLNRRGFAAGCASSAFACEHEG